MDATWKLLGSTMKFIEGGFHRGEFFPGRDAWDTGGGGCYAAEETENREIIYPICI